MRIIFVRHGHPDYAKDCLTEIGQKHAKAAAIRLADEKIDAFFSSSCGRAVETCEHISALHGDAPIEKLDFMREIGWGPKTEGDELPENGHPWHIATKTVGEARCLLDKNWKESEPYCRSKVTWAYDKVAEGFDEWLSDLGYTREGKYYRAGKPKYETVLLTSHAGSSGVVLSHIFGIPFPLVNHAICPSFTAITVVTFSNEEGALVAPRFEIMNDARHIEGIKAENIIAN